MTIKGLFAAGLAATVMVMGGMTVSARAGEAELALLSSYVGDW